MTPSATRFVGLETFAALSRNSVPVEVFNENNDDIESAWSKHIHWADWADLMVVAPCTANSLAKIVHGHSDNMLTTTVLAVSCPVLICPTMDGGMYRSAANQRNLSLAKELGFEVLVPESGYLSSGLDDTGRLPDIHVIVNKISAVLEGKSGADDPFSTLLKDKKVLVTAGPTREFIDAVRFISNPSSGKMGVAMAKAAAQMGAGVHLIHGTINIPIPADIKHTEIVSAADLFEAVKSQSSETDVVIMAAAVSDFTPEVSVSHKIKKSAADQEIKLKPTIDILKWLGENRKKGQILVGFAMETDNLESEIIRKREQKNVDWIVGNLLTQEGAGFETDTNHVIVQGQDTNFSVSGTKIDVAREILIKIFGS
jgi:phosphopantothenoylcysteine decarboxylase/phosphopantothenate--cysteine ligase